MDKQDLNGRSSRKRSVSESSPSTCTNEETDFRGFSAQERQARKKASTAALAILNRGKNDHSTEPQVKKYAAADGRRRYATGGTNKGSDVAKPVDSEALPDILDDWKIIVNSLKASEEPGFSPEAEADQQEAPKPNKKSGGDTPKPKGRPHKDPGKKRGPKPPGGCDNRGHSPARRTGRKVDSNTDEVKSKGSNMPSTTKESENVDPISIGVEGDENSDCDATGPKGGGALERPGTRKLRNRSVKYEDMDVDSPQSGVQMELFKEDDGDHGDQGDFHGDQGDLHGNQGDLQGNQGDLLGGQGDLHGNQGDLHGEQGDLHGDGDLSFHESKTTIGGDSKEILDTIKLENEDIGDIDGDKSPRDRNDQDNCQGDQGEGDNIDISQGDNAESDQEEICTKGDTGDTGDAVDYHTVESDTDEEPNDTDKIEMKETLSREEYGKWFEDRLPYEENDFEGFGADLKPLKNPLNSEGKVFYCDVCKLVFDSQDVSRIHKKIAHRRVYSCPVNLGRCGKYIGARRLQFHLYKAHHYLEAKIKDDITLDLKKGQLTVVEDFKAVHCSVCFMKFSYQHCIVHELLVHGLSSPHIMGLTTHAIDQLINIFWTGRGVAWSCHLCGNNNQTSLVVACPVAIPCLIQGHMRSNHMINIPNLHCWYIMINFIYNMPPKPKRTLGSMIALGLHPKPSYQSCLLCLNPIAFICGANIHKSQGICKTCEINASKLEACWLQCGYSGHSVAALVNHLLVAHTNRSVISGWCVKCGCWVSYLIAHILNCAGRSRQKCVFCSFEVGTLGVLDQCLHSLNFHSFPCPVPLCASPSILNSSAPKLHHHQLAAQQRQPTVNALVSHLLAHHFPEWEGIKRDELSSLVRHCRTSNGYVLNAKAAKNLSAHWLDSMGNYYTLRYNIQQLEPLAVLPINITCIVCRNKCVVNITKYDHAVIGICEECEVGVRQSKIGEPPFLCPVWKCKFITFSNANLYNHIIGPEHGLINAEPIGNCIPCVKIPENSLSFICHYILCHSYLCILCSDTFVSVDELVKHRIESHNAKSWYNTWQLERKKKSAISLDQKGISKSFGVLRVWNCNKRGAIGAYLDPNSQCDPGIEFEKPSLCLADYNEEDFGEKVQPDETSEWLGDLCAVTMSPKTLDVTSDRTSTSISASISTSTPKKESEDVQKGEIIEVTPSILDIQATYSNSDSEGEPPLQIDSNAPSPDCSQILSPGQKDSKTNQSGRIKDSIKIPLALPGKSVDIADHRPLISLDNEHGDDGIKTPLYDRESPFASPGEKTAKTKTGKAISRKTEGKGLGENAFIDEMSMSVNILKDLAHRYSCMCTECTCNISLTELHAHVETVHGDCTVYCSCDFTGTLNTVLVHSFHMSHMPSGVRPLILQKDAVKIYLVFQELPNVGLQPHPCYKCGKAFKQEKSRQLHYNLCKLEKKYECDICNEKFVRDYHLAKHKEWKHNPQSCPYCSKTFTSNVSLTQHALHIHKKQLSHQCAKCGDNFSKGAHLRVHMRHHNGVMPHACTECAEKFISRNMLAKHKKQIHRDNSDSDSGKDSASRDPESRVISSGMTESDLDTSETEEEAKATLLSEKFIREATNSDVKSVKSPVPTVTPVSTPKSKKSKPSKLQSDEPALRPEIRQLMRAVVGNHCIPCGQDFSDSAGTLLHMYLIHPGQILNLGLSVCGFCKYNFTSPDDIVDHHLEHHQRKKLDDGTFQCLCGLIFREEGAYYFHLYYAHKAQRALNVGDEIVCRLCDGKPSLNKIVDLVVHLSDHHTMFDHVRVNDSYMCNFCYKAFESWTVLSLHFFMVHKATKSQTLSYDCPYCKGASPWHSLEALQYHLENVHRGIHGQAKPVPEHSRSIYTPAPVPYSPEKEKRPSPPRPLPQKKKRKKKTETVSAEDSETLYCICQCPYDEVSDMIGCDNTDCKYQWFHFECVGIMAAPEGNWYCPDCTEIARKQQKTQRQQSQVNADLYDYYCNFSDNEADRTQPETPDRSQGEDQRQRKDSSSSSSSSTSSSSSSSSSSSLSSSMSSDSSSDNEDNRNQGDIHTQGGPSQVE